MLLGLQRADRTRECGHERQREQRRCQPDGGPVGLQERVEGELPGCDDGKRCSRADDLEGPCDDRAEPISTNNFPSGGRDQPRRDHRGLREPGHTHQSIVAVPSE